MSHRLLRGYKKNCWEKYLVSYTQSKWQNVSSEDIWENEVIPVQRFFFKEATSFFSKSSVWPIPSVYKKSCACYSQRERECQEVSLAPANKNATSSQLSFANSIPARPYPQTNIRKCLSSVRVTFMKQKID